MLFKWLHTPTLNQGERKKVKILTLPVEIFYCGVQFLGMGRGHTWLGEGENVLMLLSGLGSKIWSNLFCLVLRMLKFGE